MADDNASILSDSRHSVLIDESDVDATDLSEKPSRLKSPERRKKKRSKEKEAKKEKEKEKESSALTQKFVEVVVQFFFIANRLH